MPSLRKLYLDDLRRPPAGWDCVRSYDAFVAYLKEHGVPDVISFDHDLADEHYPRSAHQLEHGPVPYESYREKTGYDCAKYLVENDLGLPRVIWLVHSMNPVGRHNIEFLLESYSRELQRRRS